MRAGHRSANRAGGAVASLADQHQAAARFPADNRRWDGQDSESFDAASETSAYFPNLVSGPHSEHSYKGSERRSEEATASVQDSMYDTDTLAAKTLESRKATERADAAYHDGHLRRVDENDPKMRRLLYTSQFPIIEHKILR